MANSITSQDRFRRLKDKTGLSFRMLGEIFGVDAVTVQAWYSGRNTMAPDCLRTMIRLEGPDPILSPKINPKTVEAFFDGYWKAKA